MPDPSQLATTVEPECESVPVPAALVAAAAAKQLSAEAWAAVIDQARAGRILCHEV